MTERALQAFTRDLLALMAWPDVLYLHIANGVIMSGEVAKRAGRWQKQMGIRPGAADWLIVVNGKALFLELKSKKGVQSHAQKDFEQSAIGAGASYALCRTPDQVKNQLDAWGVLRKLYVKFGPGLVA